jgi:hypothetical protein
MRIWYHKPWCYTMLIKPCCYFAILICLGFHAYVVCYGWIILFDMAEYDEYCCCIIHGSVQKFMWGVCLFVAKCCDLNTNAMLLFDFVWKLLIEWLNTWCLMLLVPRRQWTMLLCVLLLWCYISANAMSFMCCCSKLVWFDGDETWTWCFAC